MARQRRDAEPGLFHVSTHSVWTSVLFRDDVDRMLFATELAKTVSRLGWTCMCVTLMTTHYHLLIETYDRSLPVGMKHLNLSHATRFNARHRLRGHVVDGRYWSKRIESDEYLLAAFRYVCRNAPEAGASRRAADWPWCSYRAIAARSETFTFVDVTRVQASFGPGGATAADLRRLVDAPTWDGPTWSEPTRAARAEPRGQTRV